MDGHDGSATDREPWEHATVQARSLTTPDIIILPGPSLPQQVWRKNLHAIINEAFKNKNIQAFPETWTRLHADPTIGIERLAHELGPDGHFAVVLQDDQPIACGAVLPSRGLNWVDAVKSDKAGEDGPAKVSNGEITAVDEIIPDPNALPSAIEVEDWEICCFCVHPTLRQLRLSGRILDALIDFVKARGGKRLLANYVIEETGEYWPKMGFETVANSGGTLKKGFTHTAGMPGLLEDIHFRAGIKSI